jgi:DNA polymerase
MDSTIIDLIEQYLNDQKLAYGNYLYLDQPFDIKQINAITSQQKINEPFIDEYQVKKETLTQKENHNRDLSPKNISQPNVSIFISQAEWNSSTSIAELNDKIKDCKNCPLGSSRQNFVFGTGNPHADIMIIGEAPGADEDEQGKPFVGRAGQLLTKILEAINLTREEVFIANILKCRPPDNRVLNQTEVEQCEPYLKKQIELIKPQFILALGLTAANTLFKSKMSMTQFRGSIHIYNNIKTIVTYHPSALLRNPNWKAPTWQDVKWLRQLYDEYLKQNEK